MRKITLLVGAGIGYVLGTRAGRERYDQLVAQAQRVIKDPRVQEKAQQAADTVKEQAPVVKDKVADAASKVTSSSSSDEKATVTAGAGSGGTFPSSPTSPSTPTTSHP